MTSLIGLLASRSTARPWAYAALFGIAGGMAGNFRIVFLLRSPYAYNEVVVSMLDEPIPQAPAPVHVWMVGLTSAIIILITITPLSSCGSKGSRPSG